MPMNPRQTRQQIAIPSDGIAEIHKVLTEYLAKFGEGHEQENTNTPKITAENKSFLFHSGKNDRGEFVRISEVIILCQIEVYSNFIFRSNSTAAIVTQSPFQCPHSSISAKSWITSSPTKESSDLQVFSAKKTIVIA